MKLNIEELAVQAGMVGQVGPNGQNTEFVSNFMCADSVNIKHLETFARLIVERCAVECSKQWQIDGQFSADEFAAAIRNLLED